MTASILLRNCACIAIQCLVFVVCLTVGMGATIPRAPGGGTIPPTLKLVVGWWGQLSFVGPPTFSTCELQNIGYIQHTCCYCIAGLYQDYREKSSAVAEMGGRGHNRHGPKRGSCCAPFAGAGTPSSTMWPGPRSTSVPSGVFIHPGHNRHGPKIGWGCAHFSVGSWVHIEHNVAYAEAYLRTKWHLDPCSRLATIDVGRKLCGAVPLLG